MAALLDELQEEAQLLEPQVRGLDDLLHASISPTTGISVRDVYTAHHRRLLLVRDVIAAIDALDDDGYPTMDVTEVSNPVYGELQEQLSDMLAALDEFEPVRPAFEIAITLGPFTDLP